jgi:dTDP-4-amino-4,6-dideoxygalactose transaminase
MSSSVHAVQKLAVPFLDLKQQYRDLKEAIDDAIEGVLAKAQYIQGPKVAEFEAAFAEYCGVSEAIAVDSGTAALHLVLVALGVKSGDEVVVPTNTFIATAAAVHVTGARPVFVDADPETWQMDLKKLSDAIGPRCRAVIGVHLYGQPLGMSELVDLCRERAVVLIEDAAQAHGARVKKQRVGSFGHAGCFSFYPGKNLGAFGDGGMITTNDRKLAEQLKRLRDHGRITKYEHSEVGFNFRMDAIQAVVLHQKLAFLDGWNEKRRGWAEKYREALQTLPLRLPGVIPHTEPVYHLFTICCEERDQLAAFLAERGIETGIHYPVPLHLQPAFAYLGHSRGDFPIAEDVAQHIISLPVFPEMTEEQCEHVVTSITDYFELRRA